MSIILRKSILVLIFASFSAIKAGENTSLKPESSTPPEQEAAPSNAITYDQWSRLNIAEIMSRVLVYLTPKELKIILLSSNKEKTDGHVNELRKAVLLLTTDKTFRSRFPNLVWRTAPPKFTGIEVLENAWSCVNFPWIAKKFGEILNDNDKTADEKIADMNQLYRVIKEQSRHTERRLEMLSSEGNPVLRVFIDLLAWSVCANNIWSTNSHIIFTKFQVLHLTQTGSNLRDQIKDQISSQLPQVQVGIPVFGRRTQATMRSWLPKELFARINAQVNDYQIPLQFEDQVSAFWEKVNSQSEDRAEEEEAAIVRLITHYRFLIFQLNVHFRLGYSFLNDLNKMNIPKIPSDFDAFIPTLKESIKTQLSLLEDDGTDFLIRNELQRMLHHFPDEG